MTHQELVDDINKFHGSNTLTIEMIEKWINTLKPNLTDAELEELQTVWTKVKKNES